MEITKTIYVEETLCGRAFYISDDRRIYLRGENLHKAISWAIRYGYTEFVKNAIEAPVTTKWAVTE